MHSLPRLFFLILLLAATLNTQARRWPHTTERADSAVVRALKSIGVPFADGNSIVLLPSGQEKFDDMFAAIRQARHYVHLEYFNFRRDSIGRAVFRLLCDKAREGVRVRVLFDSWGNVSNDRPVRDSFVDSVRNSGVEVGEFDRMRFPWINHAYHRDHQKIVVVDGAIAYAGGMNVADYYIHGKPEFGRWRDMHFRLEGGAVALYEELFATMWRKVSHQDIDSLTGRVLTPPEAFTGLRPDTSSTRGHITVGVAQRVPLDRPAMMRDVMTAMMDMAQRRIVIVNPYFTPVRQVTRALKRALKRGVKVEIMVSQKCDIPFTPHVVAYRVNRLRRLGATVYYYGDGFHHTKVMMVDDSLCTIGSANLNSRSLCYDYECNAIIADPAVTAALQRIFDADVKLSVPLNKDTVRQLVPPRRKFLGWLSSILTPFI